MNLSPPLQLQLPPKTLTPPTPRTPIIPSPLLKINPKPIPNPNHGFIPLTTISHSLPSNIPTTDSGLLFRQKILFLEALNIDSAKSFNKNPHLRSTPLKNIKSVIQCLYSFGIEKSDIRIIFGMYPELLTCNIYNDLYPVFDFLINVVEVPYEDVRKCISRCPRLLVCGVDDQLVPTLCFLKRLGFVGKQKVDCQTTLLLVSSVEATLVPKIEYIMSLGFEYNEVVNMILRAPNLLTFSIRNNFMPKVEYFLEEMKGDLKELKRFPQYFSFSLEGKIKRRHCLLVSYGLKMSLAEMLKVSDGEFRERLMEMRLREHDEKKFCWANTAYVE